jgi:hypothetical protein
MIRWFDVRVEKLLWDLFLLSKGGRMDEVAWEFPCKIQRVIIEITEIEQN